MNEANLLRTLRQYRKVRSADFHQPVTRDSKGKIEDDRGVVKRHPLSKEERAEAEKVLALEAGVGNNGADRAGQTLSADGAAGTHGVGEPINAVDFFRVFDGWVDSKYPGDRGSATKVKVAFRKQHRAMVANLCLEDLEDIAQAMQ